MTYKTIYCTDCSKNHDILSRVIEGTLEGRDAQPGDKIGDVSLEQNEVFVLFKVGEFGSGEKATLIKMRYLKDDQGVHSSEEFTP